MNKHIKKLQEEFFNSPDLIVKNLKINLFSNVYIIYLESLCSSDKINEYILKNLILEKRNINKNNIINFIAGSNTKKITNPDQCEFYLTNGFTLVIIDNILLAVETKADINRGVSESKTESSINGPKDSFTENIQINLGLVKRRLKSNFLKNESLFVGRKTKTNINILYFEDIVNLELISNIKEKLENIDIDGVLDSSSIGFLLDGENKSVYPTFLQTERPDLVATSLLEGKVAILVDTSPMALIIPAFFIDFINPNIDNYNKSKNVNFIKILRFVTFFISMMAPAIYIAIMNYNPETIPTSLLINFASQRNGVPFPTIIETILMLLICDIMRESDLRFPSNYGSAISILGAIILGEASVEAGVVSPITIIIVAITFISSLMFTNTETNNALRFFRFIFIALSGFFGLYGMILGLFFFLIYTTNTTSFGKPYFAPISPYNNTYFNETFLKQSIRKRKKRSHLFTLNNKTRQR